MARTDHHTEQRAQRWRREFLRYNARPRMSRTAVLREQIAYAREVA